MSYRANILSEKAWINQITKLFTQDIKAISTTALQNYYVLASDKDYIPYMDGFALDTHEKAGQTN